jgi:murein DD-endopeptidase MepM/ murein hydrolase activator NlpD/SH3-like domain-containing protein
LFAACGSQDQPGRAALALSHDEYREALTETELATALLTREWLKAADSALSNPASLKLPHYQRGVFLPHDPRALGAAFEAVEGQQLRYEIEISDDSEGHLFAQLFLDESRDGDLRFKEVAQLALAENSTLRVEQEGRYLVRLQPELLAHIDYQLRLELDAALEFPVSQHGRGNIGSVFGDPRDGGRRQHEGVDIFAPRETPVLAVENGTAIPSSSRLGGNTVWLRGAGKSYYYAHLERAAFDSRKSVSAGDVIGYVGNTGNAVTTPPHLHFGIYAGNRRAINPDPYLVDRIWDKLPETPVALSGYTSVSAQALNLRAGPGLYYKSKDRLEQGALLNALASSGDWVQVQTEETSGWIHADYQQPPTPLGDRKLRADAWLHSRPGQESGALARLYAGENVQVFAERQGWQLLGTADEPLGWALAQADLQPERAIEREAGGHATGQ